MLIGQGILKNLQTMQIKLEELVVNPGLSAVNKAQQKKNMHNDNSEPESLCLSAFSLL